MQPLQALGISADAERVYLDLVSGSPSAELEHAATTMAVAELEAAGLIERSGDTLVACPPQLAMEALAERYAALARQSAAMLTRIWNKASETYLEVLPSYSAGRAVLDRVQTDAQSQVRAISVGNLGPDGHKIVDGLFDALARGVSYQVVYGTRVLHDPEALRMVQRCVDAGEQARVFPHVSMNLTIVDERWALLTARSDEDIAAVVVHRSPLLTGFVGIFDAYWRMAVPITAGTETVPDGDTPSRDTQRLLTYLSAGLTDEAIAREFGVSERTVARRISRLQEILGAQTRFQLGVQASRHGWL